MANDQRFVYLVWMDVKNDNYRTAHLEGVFETETKANEWIDKWSSSEYEHWWISKRVFYS